MVDMLNAMDNALAVFTPDDERGTPCACVSRGGACSPLPRGFGPLDRSSRMHLLKSRPRDMVASPYSLRTGPLAHGGGTVCCARAENAWSFSRDSTQHFEVWSRLFFRRKCPRHMLRGVTNSAPSLCFVGRISHGSTPCGSARGWRAPLGAADARGGGATGRCGRPARDQDKHRPRAQKF
jgi:hypothetical protein